MKCGVYEEEGEVEIPAFTGNNPGECISGHYLYGRIVKKLTIEETKVFIETIAAFLFEKLPAPLYSLMLLCLREVIEKASKKDEKAKDDWWRVVSAQWDTLLKGLVSIIQRAEVLEIKLEALFVLHLYLVKVMVRTFKSVIEGSSAYLQRI